MRCPEHLPGFSCKYLGVGHGMCRPYHLPSCLGKLLGAGHGMHRREFSPRRSAARVQGETCVLRPERLTCCPRKLLLGVGYGMRPREFGCLGSVQGAT